MRLILYSFLPHTAPTRFSYLHIITMVSDSLQYSYPIMTPFTHRFSLCIDLPRESLSEQSFRFVSCIRIREVLFQIVSFHFVPAFVTYLARVSEFQRSRLVATGISSRTALTFYCCCSDLLRLPPKSLQVLDFQPLA